MCFGNKFQMMTKKIMMVCLIEIPCVQIVISAVKLLVLQIMKLDYEFLLVPF